MKRALTLFIPNKSKPLYLENFFFKLKKGKERKTKYSRKKAREERKEYKNGKKEKGNYQ